MADRPADRLIDSIVSSGLLAPEVTPTLEFLRAEFSDPDGLADEMVRRRWITSFQAERLLQGRDDELVLGPYALLELLGEGGMGRVYKARHRLMNRIVALKVIRAELLAAGDSRQRFLREIEAAARVWHPNLVTALDASAIGDNFLLVMEYVDGTTLSRLLAERGPAPIRHACDWIRQAALGLNHAHEQGLIHRDVKPSNLLLTSRGNVLKVLDLGLARLDLATERPDDDEPLTASGVVIGTPDYMAPEQAIAPRSVDARADLYSLGCTLYHLLTGRPPFPGGSLTQKLLRHQHEDAVDPCQLRASLPASLGAVVFRLLAKNPERRPATGREVAELLATYCSASRLVTLPVPEDPSRGDVAFPSGSSPPRSRSESSLQPAMGGVYDLLPDATFPEPDPTPSEAELEIDIEIEAEPPPGLPRPARDDDDSWWRGALQPTESARPSPRAATTPAPMAKERPRPIRRAGIAVGLALIALLAWGIVHLLR